MVTLKRLSGCAMREMSPISYYTPRKNIELIRDQVFQLSGLETSDALTARLAPGFQWQPFIIFSDIVRKTEDKDRQAGGDRMAAFIREHELGVLHETGARKNWTDNIVVAYIWEVDYPALDQLYKKWDEEAPKVAAVPPNPVLAAILDPTLPVAKRARTPSGVPFDVYYGTNGR